MRLGRTCALALAILVAAPFTAAAQVPDTVLVNGKVVTVDDRFTIAQALAIKGGRILNVGTTAEIEALKGPSTRTIDLGGRTVIPGLIDNHAHWVARRRTRRVALRRRHLASAGARDAGGARAQDARRRLDRGAGRLVGGAVY